MAKLDVSTAGVTASARNMEDLFAFFVTPVADPARLIVEAWGARLDCSGVEVGEREADLDLELACEGGGKASDRRRERSSKASMRSLILAELRRWCMSLGSVGRDELGKVGVIVQVSSEKTGTTGQEQRARFTAAAVSVADARSMKGFDERGRWSDLAKGDLSGQGYLISHVRRAATSFDKLTLSKTISQTWIRD